MTLGWKHRESSEYVGVILKIAIFFAFMLCCFSVDTEAQSIVVPHFSTSEITQSDISTQLTYLSIGSAQLPNYQSALKDWLHSFKARDMSSPFKDRYVTVFEIYNDTQIEKWFLHSNGSVVETLQISVYKNNNVALTTLSGLDHENSYPLHYGSHITVQPGETVTVLMLFSSDFFFAPMKIKLQTQDHMKHIVAIHNVTLFTCFGICLALGLYNLFIFIVMRDNQYLYYALSTLFYASAWAALFGVFEYLNLFSMKVWQMPGFLLGSAFSAFFQIAFFRLNITSKRIMYLLLVVGCLCLLLLPLAFYSQAMGLIAVSIMSTAVLLIGLGVGIVAWKQGYKPARYFVIALICVIAPNIIGNLLNLRILPGIGNIDIYLLGFVGIAADSLILAFALAEKMRLINLRNSQLKSQLEQAVELRTQALVEANQNLALSNRKLVEANSAKDHFLANMSHEIRTPLTSIMGYADGILLGDIDKAEQERVTNIIYQNGAHLLHIINDILDLSKIDANKLDFDASPCHLFSLLGEIESVVSKRAKDKGLRFRIDYVFPLPEKIITDATRLKQILFNLTNNALKFTHLGHIRLHVSILDSMLVIEVIDSGEGISQGDLHKLFNPFTQADSLINRQVGGTGLGLSIAKRLAQGLGGDIKAKSQPRQGSNFTITIKLVTPKDTPWLSTAQEVDLSNINQVVHSPKLPLLGACKVLLADDHPNNRELVALLLKRMNIAVTEVATGRQALGVLQTEQFNLLLLDIHMPELDGVETLKHIRSLGNTTPAIALTANTMKHEVDYYLRIGFTDHLAKPIERNIFVNKVSRYLNLTTPDKVKVADDKMLPLINGYIADLRNELTIIEKAWLNKDLTAITESIHKIKGAAGSFGLANISEVFKSYEILIADNDEITLIKSIAKPLEFAHMCLDLPGVDVAQAIVNFNQSLETYLVQLPAAISRSEAALNEVITLTRKGDTLAALKVVGFLQQAFAENAFTHTNIYLAKLSSLLITGEQNISVYEYAIEPMKIALLRLSEALK